MNRHDRASPSAIDEILVDTLPGETRVAMQARGRLVELRILRPGQASLVGAVWRGRVTSVRRDQAAAYVEIGQAKAGFLSLRRAAKPPTEGGTLLVQVIKDAVDEKGPGLTDRPAILGRNLTLRVGSPGLERSRRLDPEALERAAKAMAALDLTQDGFILHPSAAEADDATLLAEARALTEAWATSRDAARGAPTLVRPAPDPVLRAILDHAATLERVIFDSAEALASARAALAPIAPELVARLGHDAKGALFRRNDVEGQIAEALSRRVNLRRGGAIVIDELEAMTVIDVDMAAQASAASQAESAFQLNQEAAQEIARQIRLRDIGGIVVVDFLRLASADHRRRLVEALRRACSSDPQQVDVLGMTPAGLVEVTRKRLRPSLAHLMLAPLGADSGGRAPTPEAQAFQLARAILRAAAAAPGRPVAARAAPAVVAALEAAAGTMDYLRARIGATVTLKGDATTAPGQVDVTAE